VRLLAGRSSDAGAAHSYCLNTSIVPAPGECEAGMLMLLLLPVFAAGSKLSEDAIENRINDIKSPYY